MDRNHPESLSVQSGCARKGHPAMQRAFVDEAEQHAFRNELEALLRCGEADAALASVRERMAALAGAGLPIIDLALRADPDTVSLKG